jgi:methylmalonyl-CoA/ethylmalonyl-CoA epimerase
MPNACLDGSIGPVRVLGIHHVGVAVADLDEAVTTWGRLFGAEVEVRETVADQGVESALLRVGDGRIELLASLEPDTPVGKFLDRRGPGMHHVAIEVEDVAAELERLAADGAELIDERPRTGLEGREVAFVHPHATGGVLAELVARG